jgi:4-hydroxythreonine-4-phosphate dehydrogenase
MENRLKVGITQGDMNGISYELIIKILAENKLNEICTPVLYGSSKVAAYYRKMFDVANFSLNTIQKTGEANDKRSNIINHEVDEAKIEVGVETDESKQSAMLALETGLNDLDRRNIEVLTLAPQSAASYVKEDKGSFLEFFAQKYEVNRMMPIWVGERVKMAFLTSLVPCSEISQHLSTDDIVRKLQLLQSSLQADFAIRKPRIAVLALNPNTDVLGEEERTIILPAIERARDKGVMAMGPYVADRLFAGTDYEKFDAILALCEEQAVLPFKSIEEYAGAAYLAGLPRIVTYTVNGEAYDIAGKGKADESGLRNAIYLGIDVYRNRTLYKKLLSRPLPHYDIAGTANESDMNVEQIAGVSND